MRRDNGRRNFRLACGGLCGLDIGSDGRPWSGVSFIEAPKMGQLSQAGASPVFERRSLTAGRGALGLPRRVEERSQVRAQQSPGERL